MAPRQQEAPEERAAQEGRTQTKAGGAKKPRQKAKERERSGVEKEEEEERAEEGKRRTFRGAARM